MVGQVSGQSAWEGAHPSDTQDVTSEVWRSGTHPLAEAPEGLWRSGIPWLKQPPGASAQQGSPEPASDGRQRCTGGRANTPNATSQGSEPRELLDPMSAKCWNLHLRPTLVSKLSAARVLHHQDEVTAIERQAEGAHTGQEQVHTNQELRKMKYNTQGNNV